MKKLSVLLFCAFFVAYLPKANAQLKGFSIGPYVEGALPVGDFGDAYKSGIGGGLNADIKIPLTKLGVTISGGYMHFNAKKLAAPAITPADLNAIPIRAGLKVRLSVLYAKVEAGVAKYTKDGYNSSFLVAPGIGVRVLGLDIEAKYENWAKNNVFKKSLGFAGLKVGLNL